ncbi:MAG: TonB-dependent receptor, partial [Bacteroidota bacterium]
AAAVLEDKGMVFVQKSQQGGGSPNLRGFEANRVLLVVDGVRMNNAIYRNGHLQNAITLDPSILKQVDVIFGPGSLLYGSDALGGVVHYQTRDPFSTLKDKTFDLNVSTRYASANQEVNGHVDFSFGNKKWASLTSISYSDFGDLRAGNNRLDEFPDFGKRRQYVNAQDGRDQVINNEDVNVQVGSGYEQFDLMQKVSYRPNEATDLTLNVQLSSSSDIPRYDRLIERRNGQLRFAEWNYGPQNRFMTSLKARFFESSKLYDKAILIASFQRIDEDRFDRRLNSPEREQSLVDVSVYTLTGDFDKYLNEQKTHKLSYGFELNHNDVRATASLLNIQTNQISSNALSRYASEDNWLQNAGVFANYHWAPDQKSFEFTAGLRWSTNRVFSKYSSQDPIEWPDTYLDGISASNNALTWAVSLQQKISKYFKIKALAASAFRSPNIDDFGRIRENNGFVTMPNPDLQPERSVTTEVSLQFQKNKLEAQVTVFRTWLNDAIIRSNFQLPDGSTFFISRGDSLFVQANINVDQARLYGFSAAVNYSLDKSWSFFSNLSYTEGSRNFEALNPATQQMEELRLPLDHIPPLYGRVGVGWKNKRLELEATFNFNAAKPVAEYSVAQVSFDDNNNQWILDREGTSDNIDLGVVVNKNGIEEFRGVYAWQTLNIYSKLHINQIFSINLSVENISDFHYRTFSSGVSAPGRNFILALRGKI